MEHPDPAQLNEVPLFAGLPSDDLATLASWLDVQEINAGRVPIQAQQAGYAFFILYAGKAHVEVDDQIVKVLSPGEVFGEMAFFQPDGRRTATIVADTEIQVLTMFGTRFRQMQTDMPEVSARLQNLVEERAGELRVIRDGSNGG